MILTVCMPIIVGIIAGLLYGYSFVMQQRSIFFSPSKHTALYYFCMRIVVALVAGAYLLRSPKIPSILGVVIFTLLFWAFLLTAKAKAYEGR